MNNECSSCGELITSERDWWYTVSNGVKVYYCLECGGDLIQPMEYEE